MAVSAAVREGEEVGTSAVVPGPRAPAPARRGWHTFRVALGTLGGGLVVLVLLTAIFLAVVSRTSDRGVPRVFGQTFLVILSGSMTPTLDAGDVILDRTLTASQAAHLHKGQVITFEAGPASAPASVLITHRIYKVSSVQNPQTYKQNPVYETKGDANISPDGNTLHPDQILGVYEYRVPFAGYLLNVLHQPIVFILLVSSPFLLLIASEATRRWKAVGPSQNNSGGSSN
ncbi:MAG: signal peptidase I [Candidatus Dormibacteria bacterium]